jgi:hypothetical protein
MGRPSAGSDQSLSAPILILGPLLFFPATPRVQVLVLFLLAAHRGQISSVLTPFPRFSDRHIYGVF